MNAGAYNGEMKNIVETVEIVDKDGNIRKLGKKELKFGYRTSSIKTEGYLVTKVVYKLEKGNYNDIINMVLDFTKRREEKQPLEYPSAGSAFKRPEGFFAGKLIQDCGLKGFSIGDAAVSDKHSGFVINKGSANAKQVIELLKYIQQEVNEKFNVKLETEIRIIGED